MAASQSRAFLSIPPVSKDLAVGAERHAINRIRMPQGRSDRRPDAASQSRAVLSQLPVRIVRPSGLNFASIDCTRCCIGWPIETAGGGVPEPRPTVEAAGKDLPAVWAEGDAEDEA